MSTLIVSSHFLLLLFTFAILFASNLRRTGDHSSFFESCADRKRENPHKDRIRHSFLLWRHQNNGKREKKKLQIASAYCGRAKQNKISINFWRYRFKDKPIYSTRRLRNRYMLKVFVHLFFFTTADWQVATTPSPPFSSSIANLCVSLVFQQNDTPRHTYTIFNAHSVPYSYIVRHEWEKYFLIKIL